MEGKKSPYTCNEYRQEMMLLGLRRRLNREGLTDAEKEQLQHEIAQLETDMQMR